MKKAADLSIQTIVVAAIALIVLIVIIAIFTGRIRIFAGGARDCATLGGNTYCASKAAGCSDLETGIPGTNCEDSHGKGALCCVPILEKE